MLFVANFLAVQLAGAVVLSSYGMLRAPRERHRAPNEGQAIFVTTTTAQGITRLPTRAENTARAAASIEAQATEVVRAWIADSLPGAALDGVTVALGANGYAIDLELLSPRPISANQAAVLSRAVISALGVKAQVRVRHRRVSDPPEQP